MSLESDFRALMAGDPTIIGLVPATSGLAIYPGAYAQNAPSQAIRYMKVTGSTGLHMGGSDGLSESTMQVDGRVLVASGVNAAAKAEAIRDAIVSLFHAYRGVQGGTDFRLIELASDRGIQFEKTDAQSFYTCSLDFTVASRTV